MYFLHIRLPPSPLTGLFTSTRLTWTGPQRLTWKRFTIFNLALAVFPGLFDMCIVFLLLFLCLDFFFFFFFLLVHVDLFICHLFFPFGVCMSALVVDVPTEWS